MGEKMTEKNMLGEELLSDGELLDEIYNWMGRIRKYSDREVEISLATEILRWLRENEPEETSNE
tara:strand:+ start:408 stop:599 length:192 start_codon:yes stop_codon:yes gene_type:complete